MILFPAIDLYEGKAVRLYKGDYSNMTVYSDKPLEVAKDFAACGITHIHMVDLEGARSGETPNLETVLKIKKELNLFCEIGGGIRGMEVISRYVNAGMDRVILGTAAVKDEALLREALERYSDKVAVGVDIKDGCVAIKGWEENSGLEAFEFVRKMKGLGVSCLICTDISRDGAMRGANRELYKRLKGEFDVNITASGGVSSLEDIRELRRMGLYGAIIGKAYYTGDIDLKLALEAAK